MAFDWLRRVRQGILSVTQSSALTRPRPRRGELTSAVPAMVQWLEPRTLLSASPVGPEFQVNTFTTGAQKTFGESPQSVAMDADGDFVVTWSSFGPDGDDYGIYAQRFNAAGVAQGNEFGVNSHTTGAQRNATAAMDADGDFVITWSSYAQDGDGYGVYAQRYNAAGVAQGSEFQVNSFTTGVQWWSTVAMDADGDFVVTWSSANQDGDNYGIYAQRYNAAGVAQGSEFQVNSFTTGVQRPSSVAMDADGDFVVTWTSSSQDDGTYGVYAQRYDATGVAQGGEFQVNSFTTGSQFNSTVAMDADGDFVITWTSGGQDGSSFGVYAQRYNAMGVAQGSEFRVNSFTTSEQWFPTVAMDADGDFVITWSSFEQEGSSSSDGIFAQRYNAAGVAQGSEFPVNTFTTSFQRWSTVAMDADGDFVVVWQSYAQDGSGYGIYAQRYDDVGPDDADDAGPTVTDILVAGDTLLPDEQIVAPPDSVTVVFSEELSTTGGAAGADSVTNPANWGLTKNGADASGLIDGITFGLNGGTGKFEAVITFTAALTPGNYVLTAKGTATIVDLFGNALDGNADGTPGDDYSRTLRVRTPQPKGSEFQVNTFTTDKQQTFPESPQSVAMDADGDFVVTWSSRNQDGQGYGVYAQRYNAAGLAQGGEFQVNTFTAINQTFSTVAMDADGDFVITWSSFGQDGSSYGIYAQRYNAAGVAQGTEFRVNSFTTGVQWWSTVAMDADGDFVVVWSSVQDGDSYGIYAQRYNAAGIAQGSEFQVNSFSTGIQRPSTVAMDADGDFVVTWSSYDQDGSHYGIYAQRYNAAGVAQGTEFQVNTFTTGGQFYSTVALDDDGDFVITWTSAGQDGSIEGVHAQRYNAAGVAQGGEFQVNSFTTGKQRFSTVAMDADGDFVVTWTSAGQDGSDYGVYAQWYNAAGVAQGSEFQINSFTAGHQGSSTVAMDADGDFVVVWRSVTQDGSDYGVYAQRYCGGNAPTDINAMAVAENQPSGTSVVLTTTDVDDPESFTYALVSGAGDTHNASFQIVVGQLQTAVSLDFEAGATRSVRLQVTDAGGLMFEKAVTIPIADVNETPTAFDLFPVINEDIPLNGGLLWAFDPETPIDSLIFTITTLPTHGTVTQVGVRGFNYVPQANYNGPDSFQFTASDGVNTSAPATVSITINPVNDVPTAFPISPTINEDTPLIGGLLWASDVETPINSLIYTITTLPTHGTVTQTGVRGFNYVPQMNYNGPESFQFTASDGVNTSAPATVSITINPVNDTPTAFSISPTINEDTPLNGGLLWASDVETPINSLIYTIITLPAHGTVTQVGVRGFNYVPQANYNGPDSFQFTASDGVNTSAPATVSITINPVNDTPVAFGISPVIDEDTSLIGGLLWAFDVETPINSLIFTITVLPTNGTVVQTGVRSFNYTPNPDYNGPDSFQFTASDGVLTSAPATVSITINPVAGIPSFDGSPLTADARSLSDGLTISLNSLSMSGTIAPNNVLSVPVTQDDNDTDIEALQEAPDDGLATTAAGTFPAGPLPTISRRERRIPARRLQSKL